MDIVIILLVVFSTLFIPQFFGRRCLNNRRKGQVAMGVMLLCTGIAHFTNSKEMVAMLPPEVPFRTAIVYLTGLIELAFAAGFILNRFLRGAALAYIIFLVVVLPANIYGAIHDANVGGGHISASYLWFRIPLQLFFIAWTWYFALRPVSEQPNKQQEA